MNSQQINHIEQQLIQFIDRVMEKKEKATPAEIMALPGVASALATIHEL